MKKKNPIENITVLSRVARNASSQAIKEAFLAGVAIHYISDGKLFKQYPDGRKLLLKELPHQSIKLSQLLGVETDFQCSGGIANPGTGNGGKINLRKESTMVSSKNKMLSSFKESRVYRFFDKYFIVITCLSALLVFIWNIYFYI